MHKKLSCFWVGVSECVGLGGWLDKANLIPTQSNWSQLLAEIGYRCCCWWCCRCCCSSQTLPLEFWDDQADNSWGIGGIEFWLGRSWVLTIRLALWVASRSCPSFILISYFILVWNPSEFYSIWSWWWKTYFSYQHWSEFLLFEFPSWILIYAYCFEQTIWTQECFSNSKYIKDVLCILMYKYLIIIKSEKWPWIWRWPQIRRQNQI